MKRFNFRLQRVIEVRETKEKECQRDLARSLEELNRQEDQLRRVLAESQRSQDGLRQALADRSNAGRLTALDRWRVRQGEVLRHQSDCTEKQRGDVDGKRKALVQASKEKKVLERLKERRLEEHRARNQREEQAFLDELGGRAERFWRRPVRQTEAGEEKSP